MNIKNMPLIINKKLTAEQVKSELDKIIKKDKNIGLRKHFGLSDEKTDALVFQKKA